MIFACFHFCEFFFRFFIFSTADLIFWWTSTIFRFDENFIKLDSRFWLSSKFIKTLAFFNTFEAFIFKFCIRTIVNYIEFMTTDTRQCCSSRIISRFYKRESIGIRDARGFQNYWSEDKVSVIQMKTEKWFFMTILLVTIPKLLCKWLISSSI